MTDYYQVFNLSKTELKLLCIQDNIIDILEYLEEVNYGRFLKEINILRTGLYINNPFIKNSWKYILGLQLKEKPKLKSIYYRPGYCFQRKYKYHWIPGFEYRYSRKSSIREYLYCLHKLGINNNLAIGADISSYILSFLLPKDIGREIKVKRKNENITKKKEYLDIVDRMNYCQLGHTYRGPISCRKCSELYTQYQTILCQLEIINNTDIVGEYLIPEEYSSYMQLDERYISRLKLELEMQNIKHRMKMARLENRAIGRLRRFQMC